MSVHKTESRFLCNGKFILVAAFLHLTMFYIPNTCRAVSISVVVYVCMWEVGDVIFVRTPLNTVLHSKNAGRLRVTALVKGLQWLPLAWSAAVNQLQVIYAERKSVPKRANVNPAKGSSEVDLVV